MGLKPKPTAIPMYRYDDPKSAKDPLFIILGKNDNKAPKDAYDFVFSATPLHYLQGNNNLDAFFRIIFEKVFRP